MIELADGVYELDGYPPHAINVFLLEGVLVDASSRSASRRILAQLDVHSIHAHALTHGHPDHQGSSHAVCEALEIPLWCGVGDADAVQSGDLQSLLPENADTRSFMRTMAGPGHPVARLLRAGERIGGFAVLETPGHSPGHLAFWREEDRVLILGDVLVNMNIITGEQGLAEPPVTLTKDPLANRRSARLLGGLAPELVCFGHGPPLRDPHLFGDFIETLSR